MTAAMFLGGAFLNQPFDPENGILPRLYFSDSWRWEPDADLKPRRERWGGLLLAWGALALYAGFKKRDVLARNLALWGFLAGGLGFAGGQCVQALHARRPGLFVEGLWASFGPYWLLNTAFFRFPFPWRESTVRTPNQLIFTAFALARTVVAVRRRRREFERLDS